MKKWEKQALEERLTAVETIIHKYGADYIEEQRKELCFNCDFGIAGSGRCIKELAPVTLNNDPCPYRAKKVRSGANVSAHD